MVPPKGEPEGGFVRRKLYKLALLGTVTSLALLLGFAADAGGKKGKKKKKEEETKKEEPVEPVWPSPLDPGRIDPVFKELPFGHPYEKFLTEFRVRLGEQLKPVLRAPLDARERDALKDKMDKTFEEFEKSLVEFTGQQSGYAVSVVSEEYKNNAGESLAKYAYSGNTAYFFFSGKTLWKLYICSESASDFSELLVGLATIFGDPAEVVFEDEEEKTNPLLATWRDTTFELTAAPPQGIYVCSRLKWTYLPENEAVAKRRAGTEGGEEKVDESEAFLQQVMGGEDKKNDDVLDKILEDKKNKK